MSKVYHGMLYNFNLILYFYQSIMFFIQVLYFCLSCSYLPRCPDPPMTLAEDRAIKSAVSMLKEAKCPLVIIGKGTFTTSLTMI